MEFRHKKLLLLILTTISILFITNIVSAQETKAPTEYGAPKLQMPIPGVPQFSKIQVEDGEISVPWLAQYIASVYKYGVALAVSLTILMIMIGGFLWITAAGDTGKIDKAKTLITDAVIGLILALGSYVILYTINPDIVEFKAIRMKVVEKIPWDVKMEMQLLTTTENTMDPETIIEAKTFENCPLTLTATENLKSDACKKNGELVYGPRTQKFKEKISSLFTSTMSTREKIITTANAAVKCGVHFGSCMCTVHKFENMAGVKSEQKKVSISNEQYKEIQKMACKGANNTKECRKQAKKTVYDKLKTEIPGWPESFIKVLEPGDHLTVFNAFPSGMHSTIFIGWKQKGKIANIVQGSWGKYTSAGVIDLRTTPIVRVKGPK